jgi:hypothetical protein
MNLHSNKGNVLQIWAVFFSEIVDHIGVWQGVGMDSLKFLLGPPYPTLQCPAGRVDGGSWTPHAVRIWNSLTAQKLETNQSRQ